MLNSRRRSSGVTDDTHLDRWLVSYADYMTLLFALFVVLYAFALVKEEKHTILSDSLGEILHLVDDKKGSQGSVQQNSSDEILTSGDKISEMDQYNKGLLQEVGTEPVEGDSQLVETDAKLLGTPFSSMKEKLAEDLLEVLEDGYAKIEQDDNWLTIEFSSGLLFDSGSAATRDETKEVLAKVINTIAPANNFVHVRGYTDNQPINNEQFQSNWQLSSARASAIVQELQRLNVEPQRLAIEAYGEYKPKNANDTAVNRARNRRVVIAISRFGWRKPTPQVLTTSEPQEEASSASNISGQSGANSIQVIDLPNGGVLVTTRTQEL
ncbi:OmpA family protein [Psychrobium sp. 1_MG-2023]|uniref:OmpA family protein n=1 Tax=Psychrobium sp. 1_MG-2023 TaxID=3062624 RepID=UPI000C3489AC|nr:OmpA family protein [Psychrobium sp. 1_MG-2023]MDP2559815.1 OmpA family protein [Psychrobium sp. 1_MG-2023]PKF59079.1 flagellar motor protein [Alteromonadales bacterium alter-6D02]